MEGISMMRIRYLALAPLVLLGACGTGTDPEATLDTVRLVEQAELEAIASDDLDGVMRNYAEDAVLVSPNAAPAQGAAAIRTAFQSMVADPSLKVELTPGPGWAAASGELAVTTATMRFTSTEDGADAPTTMTVANQTTWRKADGAPWQIVSDYNAALP
jgi:ketosteroid isomerase-like protein